MFRSSPRGVARFRQRTDTMTQQIKVTLKLLLLSLFILSSFTAGADSSEKLNACTDSSRAHFYRSNYSFAEAIDTCSSYSGLDTACFKRKYTSPGMSDQCLGCFGKMTSCTVSACGFKCMMSGRRSAECKLCSVEACGAAMQKCSGIDPEYWPDFRRKNMPQNGSRL